MDDAGGWTNAGALHTMTLVKRAPCPGASYVILVPAAVADNRFLRLGRLAAQTLSSPPAAAAGRHPLRPGSPHRYLLVPCRRHHRRLPPTLHHRLLRRPPVPPSRPHHPHHLPPLAPPQTPPP